MHQYSFIFNIVPTPLVIVTAPNTQTVGQSLILQCEVTTVRGITSRVDIVWSSGGTVLQRMNNVSSAIMSNSLVYTNSYTTSQLSTIDDGIVMQCEVVINAILSVMAIDSITLDVTGKYTYDYYVLVVINFSTQFPLLQSPYHHLIPYKKLW